MIPGRFQGRFLNKVLAGVLVAALFFASSLFLGGSVCAAEKPEIAVMPFVKGRDPADPGKSPTCEFGRLCYGRDDLKENADRILTRMVHEELVRKMGHRVVPLGSVKDVYSVKSFQTKARTPLDAARALGKELGVEYVLGGNVWRYEDRIGRAYSVERPASAAFVLYLVETEKGKTVWRRIYNETQQSLSENLLRAPEFFRRGAKWLTVKELAEDGVRKALKNFPLK